MNSLKHGVSRSLGYALLAAATLAAVLSGCGGGTSQIEPFAPTRILAFGDESSVITADGKKYTVNGFDTTTLVASCVVNPIWVQSLAASFGLVFGECNPDKIAAPTGVMYAVPGAKVADLKTKIDAHFAVSSFGSKDLAAILVGANDVLELYAQFPAQSQASLLDEVRARGRNLGNQVNRIANAGGRVIIATLPDMGLTPFALKEKAAKLDTDRSAFLSNLTSEFNIAMRLTIINDGRLIGLVLADESVQAIVKYPAAFGFANVTDAACLGTIAIQNCLPTTLVTGGSGDTWLWASDVLLSPAGQARLGALAQTRAKNNPF
ncbi:hypothetical protein BH11PSE10_BH11PSE10_09330 [soil metagenome]